MDWEGEEKVKDSEREEEGEGAQCSLSAACHLLGHVKIGTARKTDRERRRGREREEERETQREKGRQGETEIHTQRVKVRDTGRDTRTERQRKIASKKTDLFNHVFVDVSLDSRGSVQLVRGIALGYLPNRMVRHSEVKTANFTA